MGHVIVILLWPLHHCTGTFPCTWLQRLTLLPYLPSAVASTDHRHTSPCPVFSFPTFINVFLWQLLLKHPLSKGSSVSAQHFSPNSGQLSFYSRGLNPNKSQTYLLLWSTHSQWNISTSGLVLWVFFRCYHSAFHLSLLDSVASCRLVDTHHWLQPTTSFSAFSSTVHNIRWLTVWPWTDHELIHCHHLCFLALSSISITLIYTCALCPVFSTCFSTYVICKYYVLRSLLPSSLFNTFITIPNKRFSELVPDAAHHPKPNRHWLFCNLLSSTISFQHVPLSTCPLESEPATTLHPQETPLLPHPAIYCFPFSHPNKMRQPWLPVSNILLFFKLCL